jgi:peroxiredoxin
MFPSVFCAMVVAATLAQPYPPPPEIGERPPELPQTNWFNANQPIRLADLRGSVVVLEVWSPRSQYSLRRIETLKEEYLEWQARGARFVTICLDSPDAVERLIEREGIPYPVVAGANTEYAYLSMTEDGRTLEYVPTVIVLDHDGFVTWIKCPIFPQDGAQFEQALATALAIAPPPPMSEPTKKRPPPLPRFDPRLAEAVRLESEGDMVGAYVLYTGIIAEPTEPRAAGQAHEAIIRLRRNKEQGPRMEKAVLAWQCQRYLELARLESVRGDYDAARWHYERILKLSPDDEAAPAARRELAKLPQPTTQPQKPPG